MNIAKRSASRDDVWMAKLIANLPKSRDGFD